ncbi:MAG: helix-turn-helix domain-containing protein [Clostridia bacterium]|nr:helix-turn-helix domain-containing protein [Clostridia bacterium]
MKEAIFERLLFSVVFAERREVGEEWNDVVWNKDHRHFGYHRLYYLTEGEASIRLTDKTIDLKPRVVYLIPAFSVVESRISGKMNKYYIHFQCDERAFSLLRYLSDSYGVSGGPMTEGLLSTVVNNYTSDSPSARMKVQGAMSLLLADFIEGARASSVELDRFRCVLDHIEASFRGRIDLADLASMMNLSPAYFANLFKKTFSLSPRQYILNRRLTEAQRLLIETDMTVCEIAAEVGFDNENYFSEFFSHKTGITATKFRKNKIPSERESIL